MNFPMFVAGCRPGRPVAGPRGSRSAKLVGPNGRSASSAKHGNGGARNGKSHSWLVVWNMALIFNILGIIIPTDFFFFRRG